MFNPTGFDPTGKNPFVLLDTWLADAIAAEVNDPNATALASIAEDGFPSVRMVLMKGRDDEAVHFYTNFNSRKSAELDATKKAAMCFHWKSLRRQIRLVGAVERLDDKTTDAYYNARPYHSRIGAWASDQSSPLDCRETLAANVEKFTGTYPKDPPRPPYWGGFRLIPHEIEFWIDGDARLHDRFHFTKDAAGRWSALRLYP
ncbi:MAG: pyridoxamine 5'-phosphate oxidase [Candidatus Puniceispirillales bacterium WSBS_2018_MAG_OTU23]